MFYLIDYTTGRSYGLFHTINQVLKFLHKHQNILNWDVYLRGGHKWTDIIIKEYNIKYNSEKIEQV